jgi:hypothetical protein
MSHQPPAAPIVERDDANQQYEILVDGNRAGLPVSYTPRSTTPTPVRDWPRALSSTR